MTIAIILSGIGTLIVGRLSVDKTVIERSSDSEWVYSDRQDLDRDTVITRVAVVNGGRDTTYPTTYYKVIRREK